MTRRNQTRSAELPSPDERVARMHVGRIGEVTSGGDCWRLAYDHCEHVQEFAREGLEDPERLVRVIERNFSECLSCRLERSRAGQALSRLHQS